MKKGVTARMRAMWKPWGSFLDHSAKTSAHSWMVLILLSWVKAQSNLSLSIKEKKTKGESKKKTGEDLDTKQSSNINLAEDLYIDYD